MNKIYNFSPGPSKINESVLKEVKNSLENYKDTGKKSTGLIAQDLEEVLPEVVYETHDINNKEDKFKILKSKILEKNFFLNLKKFGYSILFENFSEKKNW